MRTPLTFRCADAVLVGTLDDAPGTTGLLIVSGGNEVRSGAHRGMAMLAVRLAADGVPVFRFDRRGVGDSSGINAGFEGSSDDIAVAARFFRARSIGLNRLVGLGNCDAATALALFGPDAGLDALVLTNPWLVEPAEGLPPPAAIRARYAALARSPRAWWRLARGGVVFANLVKGLRAILAKQPEPVLATRFAAGIAGLPTTIVLAAGDATAIAYRDATRGLAVPAPVLVDTASHSFARPGDMAALEAAVRRALAV